MASSCSRGSAWADALACIVAPAAQTRVRGHGRQQLVPVGKVVIGAACETPGLPRHVARRLKLAGAAPRSAPSAAGRQQGLGCGQQGLAQVAVVVSTARCGAGAGAGQGRGETGVQGEAMPES